MFYSPQKFRELALQMLYSRDFSDCEADDLLEFMMRSFLLSKKEMQKVGAQCEKVEEKLTEIDLKIETASTEYSMERISKIEKNILRLLLFEMIYDKLPIQVAVTEGTRLCKKFTSAEAGKFVHAILDKIYKENGDFSKISNEQAP